MDTLIYLGKVNLYWIMLFACYWLMLRNHTFFKWNRFFLLASIAAAFALPLVIYPAAAPALPVQYQVDISTFTFETAAKPQKPFMTWIEALWMIYVAGAAIAAYRLLKRIQTLYRFLRAGEAIELDDCTVVVMDSNAVGSFSFLKWIVINRNDYENHFDAILRHEMVHTRQWHSIDILLLEIVNVFFWYNPVLWLYKRSLQEVHEFLADEQASNRDLYARFLVSYALNAPVTALTNHFFNASQIKNRIQMIYKNRTSRWLLSTYAVVATFIGLSAVIVAGCENLGDEKEPEQSNVIPKEQIGNKIFTVVEQQPEFPGGMKAMFEFLADNIKYPQKAVDANVSGRVFLSFVVTETGQISDIKVLKGLGFDLDEEAVRVLSKFPKWTPGKQNGHPVNVRYNLPINFQLDEDEQTSAKQKPLLIVNGKELPEKEAGSELNPQKIASVNVLKGEQALAKYGNKGKNGVLEITTKSLAKVNNNEAAKVDFNTDAAVQHTPVSQRKTVFAASPDLADGTPAAGTQIQFRGNDALGSEPLVYIDGVKQQKKGKAALDGIRPDDIESLSVIKDKYAVEGYGDEGRNGVLLVTTRK